MSKQTVVKKSAGAVMASACFAFLLLLLLIPSEKVHAAVSCTPSVLDWAALGWDETNIAGAEVNPYFSESLHNEDPYHGLGSASGGISGFQSQSFTNVASSGVNIDIYYSQNMFDQVAIDVPNLYGGEAGPNPDGRTTGSTTLRFTRDYTDNYVHATNGSVRSPMTIVASFSEPVFLNEYIIGSLSRVGTNSENVVVRAFDGPDATGSVIKASTFDNISDLDDDSSLIHGLGDGTAAVLTNDLSNVNMDPDNTFDAGGSGTNIGSASDDGIYHAIGAGDQSASRYGRILLKYENTPVRSIAVSTWTTANATDFTEDIYTDGFHSAIFAPYVFCPLNHDYGDAPDGSLAETGGDYATTGAFGGAVHAIDTSLRIGSLIDSDDSTLQNSQATSDDSDGIDDEDGIVDTSQLTITDGQSGPTIDVLVNNSIGSSATLYGWIDYNGNGLFEINERASVAVPNATSGIVTLTFPDVPSTAELDTGGATYLRLRLSTDSDPSDQPTGAVSNGEVEDYVMQVQAAVAVPGVPDTGLPQHSHAAGWLFVSTGLGVTFVGLVQRKRARHENCASFTQ